MNSNIIGINDLQSQNHEKMSHTDDDISKHWKHSLPPKSIRSIKTILSQVSFEINVTNPTSIDQSSKKNVSFNEIINIT